MANQPRQIIGCLALAFGCWLGTPPFDTWAESTESFQPLVDRAVELNFSAPSSETRAWLDQIAGQLDRASDSQRHQLALISIRLDVLEGDFSAALSEVDRLLEQDLRADHRLRALELAANASMLDARFDHGFRYLNQALSLQDQVDDPGLRSGITGLASYWHAQFGDHDKGLEYGQLTLDLARLSGDEREVCVAYEKLAQAQEMAGLHQQALESYAAGLESCRQAEDLVFIGVMQVLTGRLLHRMGQLEEAEPWLAEGLAATELSGFEDGVFDGTLNYAELLLDQNRNDEARALLEPIFQPVAERNRARTLYRIYAMMGLLESRDGRFESAYNYLSDHLALREQVHDSERTRLIAFYEVEFDAINREQELALLREQARVASLQEATTSQQRRLRQMAIAITALLMIGLTLLLFNALRERRHFRRLSQTDPLTGLSNHTRFFEQAGQLIDASAPVDGPLTLVMADIDYFKQVNDQYGHLVGDEILCAASQIFRATLEQHGVLGRIGGEEFAACLPNNSAEGACQLIEQLRMALQRQLGERLTRPVTMSFGLAELSAGDSLESLRARADEALYKAKNAGRDRIEVAAFGDGPGSNPAA